MTIVTFDPALPVTIHPISHSPHTFVYRLWKAEPGATVWSIIEDGDINTPVTTYGPFPLGTHIDYWMRMGGNAGTTWSTEMRLSQHGVQLSCSPTTDNGRTDGSGIAEVENLITLR